MPLELWMDKGFGVKVEYGMGDLIKLSSVQYLKRPRLRRSSASMPGNAVGEICITLMQGPRKAVLLSLWWFVVGIPGPRAGMC